MPWVRFEDSFPLNRKIRRAGRDAYLLHFTATCFSARHLTDGHIDDRDFPDLAHEAMLTPEAAATALTSLIDNGLVETTSTGWVIHDFLDYQPSRAQVLSEREATRERQRQSRLSRRDSQPMSHSDSRQQSQRDLARSSGPPTRPDPTRTRPLPPPPDNGSGTPAHETTGGGELSTASLIAERQLAKVTKRIHNQAGWLAKATDRILDQHGPAITAHLADGLTTVQIADLIEPARPAYRGNPIDGDDP